jgi:hypothetical protein
MSGSTRTAHHKTYTSNTVASLRRIAVHAYIRSGGQPQAAWEAVRERLTALRAPCWDEQVATNTGCRRSYRSPLGCALEIPGACGNFGHHSARWPRTRRSRKERSAVADLVRKWLESEACALVISEA